MNIREEIENIILELRYENKYSSLEITDKIISIIEKRIDELKPSSFSLNEIRNEYYKEGFNDNKKQLKELLK